MSYYDHAWKERLFRFDPDPPFYGLLMAAIQRADTSNTAKLRAAFPDLWTETQQRYNAPGGLLLSDPASLREKVLGS